MTKSSRMTPEEAAALLKHVRMELARDHDYPNGSRERAYELVAPIDEEGHIVVEAWRLLRDRCRVKRFWPGEPSEVGHLVHKPGGAWAFHYDIHGDAAHDETGYRLDKHKLAPGEYISIKEQDGVMRTFRVTAVGEL